MVMKCCELCYDKYITKDNEIDYERIVNHIFDNMNEGYTIKDSANKLIINPCTCLCHKDGIDIIH